MQSPYLHADKTPIKVLDKDKKARPNGSSGRGATHRGYYWVYQDSIKKTVFFDYRDGRGREGPQGIMEHFKGYFQTDGYIAYEIFDQTKGLSS